MKLASLLTAILLISLSASAQSAAAEDISILGANDRSYADATNFAALVNGRGLQIKTIHKSKMEGFFREVWKAAFYKTDKGVFQVIFFDEPNQAEKITVKEVRDGKRYIYSFEGQPKPDPPRDTMNAGYRNLFLMKDRFFIVVAEQDEKVYEALKTILQ